MGKASGFVSEQDRDATGGGERKRCDFYSVGAVLEESRTDG